MGKLEEEKRRIVETNEELDNKFRITLGQLEKQTENLLVLRNEKLELEKCVTMLKHDLKKLQRKVDQEAEARTTAEQTATELKLAFESERTQRTALSTNMQVTNEKYSGLEKQLHSLTEKLKAETEAVSREASVNAELKHACLANEALVGELRAKLEQLERAKNAETEQLKSTMASLNHYMSRAQELESKY